MTEVTPLSPELSRSVSALARALVAAARNRALYPPDHPAVRTSVDRLRRAMLEAADGPVFSFGVTPATLLIDGHPAETEGPIAEAAAWLHQRDIAQVAFAREIPSATVEAFLALLAQDGAALREQGGPAKAWTALGLGGIAIEQIDFARVLEDRDVQHPARRRDDLWRAIVRAVLDRRKMLDDALQRRLLEIAGDVVAIGELAQDVMAPTVAADGSPMLTSQAAAVVAAYRHLINIVEVMEPARRTEVMQSIAAATANLDPHVVLQILSGPEEAGGPASGTDIKRAIADAFDDFKVAQLLATTLAIDGQASDRLATVFDTIAADDSRKRRVLTLTKSLLNETSFGKTGQFQALWTSMEELLLSYNERPFVSASYRTGLDQAGSRADALASSEIPPDLLALVDTLGQENVRRLSVVLLIDLLKMERDRGRAPELARDVAALCEDLLLAGDYESALKVTRALAEQGATPSSVTCEGCRVALDALVATPAFIEAVELFGDMTDAEAAQFGDICAAIGPAATDALRMLLEVEELTPARQRATSVIRKYGASAVSRLTPLIASHHWYTRVNAAELLAEIASPEGVPLLQPLLRGQDPRVLQAAVRALSSIDDPAAARALHTVLRAATGEQRRAVIAALVAEKDPRVVPVLARILGESDALGSDHPIVLEAVAALGQVGSDQAVAEVAKLMRRKSWVAWKKARALKQVSIDALRQIATPVASQAIADAAINGDRLLRKLARAAAPAAIHG